MSDDVTRKEFHHALKDINDYFAKKKALPTKLSDFDNDLYYSKPDSEPFCIVKKEDLILDENNLAYYYCLDSQPTNIPEQFKYKMTLSSSNGDATTQEYEGTAKLVDSIPEKGLYYFETTDTESAPPLFIEIGGYYWSDESTNDGKTYISTIAPLYARFLSVSIYCCQIKRIPQEYVDLDTLESDIRQSFDNANGDLNQGLSNIQNQIEQMGKDLSAEWYIRNSTNTSNHSIYRNGVALSYSQIVDMANKHMIPSCMRYVYADANADGFAAVYKNGTYIYVTAIFTQYRNTLFGNANAFTYNIGRFRLNYASSSAKTAEVECLAGVYCLSTYGVITNNLRLWSSTNGSIKQFDITVDDTGTIKALPV